MGLITRSEIESIKNKTKQTETKVQDQMASLQNLQNIQRTTYTNTNLHQELISSQTLPKD